MRAAAWAGAVVAAIGLAVMARGARLEASGLLDASRRLGRRGGFLAFAGAVALAAGSLSIGVALPALTCGAVALLGGLAGKPRPSWWVAAALAAIAIAIAL